MFADVDAIVTSFDIRQMAQWASGEGETEWRVDLVKLAHLLSIAGQMALDLRRLPRIIAEHIGSEPQLSPKSCTRCPFQGYMAGPWEGLALRLECPEPVLDVALEQVAETLSRHRLRLLQTADLTALALSLLPSHFDISQVTPALDELGIPRFQRPHLRFQLDQGRIRDLLMGTQTVWSTRICLTRAVSERAGCLQIPSGPRAIPAGNRSKFWACTDL